MRKRRGVLSALTRLIGFCRSCSVRLAVTSSTASLPVHVAEALERAAKAAYPHR